MIATLRPLTYEDLLEMPDDGQRYEIIGGELIASPTPPSNHHRVLGKLLRVLDDYARRANSGEVFFAPFDVRLGHHDVVKPDLMFLSSSRPRVPNDAISIGFAPDMVAEIISPTSRNADRVSKMALYARTGVSEYWIADPVERTLLVNILQGEAYIPVAPDADGWITSPTLVGLRIDPGAVFASLA